MVKPKDWLEGIKDYYDVIIVGSGLAGMTAANVLSKCGHSVLLLEHHYQLGGLATWFKRPGRHIFDISLHGFPVGMIKSARKYWTEEIANSIVQLKSIRFINPQFSFETTFDITDFKRILRERFKVAQETIDNFFTTVRAMNFFDDQSMTTRELLEKFFPGRSDVKRMLMEPIAYANGSTLDDPAITYGIVFSNFMSKGVFTFQGGTDQLVKKMATELRKNGADLRTNALVKKVLVEEKGGQKRVVGVQVNDREVRAGAVLSNSGLKNTIFKLTGEEHFPREFVEQANAVRINNSSCQVYIGIKKGESIPHVGDLIFTSKASEFSSEALLARNVTSRTFSMYYPETRPGSDRYSIVCSTNAHFKDWAYLSEEEYLKEKQKLIEDTIVSLEELIPDVRAKIDWTEASTPRTFLYYTHHWGGSSFGTKFEGLKVSTELSNQLPGLFHAGSVGIIMSGWLGAINYGVIVANNVDKYVRERQSQLVA